MFDLMIKQPFVRLVRGHGVVHDVTQRIAATDADEFARVYLLAYSGTVRAALALCGDRHQAEDVAQQAWANTYRRHVTAPVHDIVPYVHRAVVNEVRSRARRGVVARAHEGLTRRSVRSVAVADGSGPVVDRSVLVPLLGRLPLRMRAAVVLRVVAGLSVAQTAAALGISKGDTLPR